MRMNSSNSLFEYMKTNDIDNLIQWKSINVFISLKYNLTHSILINDKGLIFRNLALPHLAAYYNSIDCLNYMINFGVDINLTSTEGFSLLHMATLGNSIECVIYLLEKNANINIFTPKTIITPLYFACLIKSNFLINLFLQKGSLYPNKLNPLGFKTDYHPIRAAISTRNTTGLIQLLTIDDDIKNIKYGHNSPLMNAIAWKLYEAIPLLLKSSCDPSFVSSSGLSPLALACEANQYEIVKYLLDFGANVNIKLKKNRTIVHYAVLSNNPNILQLIISAGANPNIPDEKGFVPGFYITDVSKPETIEIYKILIENGLNINTINNNTSIFANLLFNPETSIELINFFLENGADINIILKDNISLKNMIYLCGTLKIIKLIENFNK